MLPDNKFNLEDFSMNKRTDYFWKITKNVALPNAYCAFVDASKQNGILHFTHEIEINFSLEDDN